MVYGGRAVMQRNIVAEERRNEIEKVAAAALHRAGGIKLPMSASRVANEYNYIILSVVFDESDVYSVRRGRLLGSIADIESIEDQVNQKYRERNSHSYGILINDDNGWRASNYCIAHQLGHLMLHKKHFSSDAYTALYTNDMFSPQNSFQAEAGVFAKSLVLPEPLLREYRRLIELKLDTASGISELARGFGVPEEVLTDRLDELGYRCIGSSRGSSSDRSHTHGDAFAVQ
ncbi:MAG: hypothetical protein Alpg2KO_01050 [Alphaproteobacteria bacterium]